MHNNKWVIHVSNVRSSVPCGLASSVCREGRGCQARSSALRQSVNHAAYSFFRADSPVARGSLLADSSLLCSSCPLCMHAATRGVRGGQERLDQRAERRRFRCAAGLSHDAIIALCSLLSTRDE